MNAKPLWFFQLSKARWNFTLEYLHFQFMKASSKFDWFKAQKPIFAQAKFYLTYTRSFLLKKHPDCPPKLNMLFRHANLNDSVWFGWFVWSSWLNLWKYQNRELFSGLFVPLTVDLNQDKRRLIYEVSHASLPPNEMLKSGLDSYFSFISFFFRSVLSTINCAVHPNR